jgi:hypothetical protein
VPVLACQVHIRAARSPLAVQRRSQVTTIAVTTAQQLVLIHLLVTMSVFYTLIERKAVDNLSMRNSLHLIGACIVLGGIFGMISGMILTLGVFGIKIASYMGLIVGLFIGVIGAVLLRNKSTAESIGLVSFVGAPATVFSTFKWPGDLGYIIGFPVCAILAGIVAGMVLLSNTARTGESNCSKCRYDLRGSRGSEVCPECGSPIPYDQDSQCQLAINQRGE